ASYVPWNLACKRLHKAGTARTPTKSGSPSGESNSASSLSLNVSLSSRLTREQTLNAEEPQSGGRSASDLGQRPSSAHEERPASEQVCAWRRALALSGKVSRPKLGLFLVILAVEAVADRTLPGLKAAAHVRYLLGLPIGEVDPFRRVVDQVVQDHR